MIDDPSSYLHVALMNTHHPTLSANLISTRKPWVSSKPGAPPSLPQSLSLSMPVEIGQVILVLLYFTEMFFSPGWCSAEQFEVQSDISTPYYLLI